MIAALQTQSPLDAVARITVFLSVWVATSALVGAVMLRAACWLYNKMVGGPSSPHAMFEPTFSRALTINLMALLVNVGIGVVLGLAGIASREPRWLMVVISMLVGFLATAETFTTMLPTTFRTAVLLELIEFLIAIVIGLILAIPTALYSWFLLMR